MSAKEEEGKRAAVLTSDDFQRHRLRKLVKGWGVDSAQLKLIDAGLANMPVERVSELIPEMESALRDLPDAIAELNAALDEEEALEARNGLRAVPDAPETTSEAEHVRRRALAAAAFIGLGERSAEEAGREIGDLPVDRLSKVLNQMERNYSILPTVQELRIEDVNDGSKTDEQEPEGE